LSSLKAGGGDAYHFFIIGNLPCRQVTFPRCSIKLETISADAAIGKSLLNDALVLEKK
jgi:hypothetical protein